MSANLTFTFEPIAYLLSCGLAALAARHWQEGAAQNGIHTFDPDWEEYAAMERADMFRVIAVRADGKLVGYAGVRIFRSMLSRHQTCSFIQEYYIDPLYRPFTGAGLKLFRFLEAQLRMMKVNRVTVGEPPKLQLENFFRHLRYVPQERLWSKDLA
jgi:hypothetical protein